MKKRLGFVSNSSSASFIISTKEGQTTADIASILLDVIEEDNRLNNYPETEQYKDAKAWTALFADYDGAICIGWTCNYSTYIYRENSLRPAQTRKDIVRVQTCNNVKWLDLLPDELIMADFMCDPPDTPYSLLRESVFIDLKDFIYKRGEEIERW